MLTIEQVAIALPPHLKKAATQSLVDQLNNISTDAEIAEAMRENFLSYTKVLTEGKFKTDDYLNAVKYVSFKLMGHTNQESYYKTFPARHAALLAKGADAQEISAYVSMYAKGKLVNLILEQTLVPTWVLNQDMHQKALNCLASEMVNARSEMVRVTAANSILTHLAKPKEVGPLINLDMRETSGVNELRDVLATLAKKQVELISNGASTRDIAAIPIMKPEGAE